MPKPTEEGKGGGALAGASGDDVSGAASLADTLARPCGECPVRPSEAILVPTSGGTFRAGLVRGMIDELAPCALHRRIYWLHGQSSAGAVAEAREAAAALGLDLAVLATPGDAASAIRHGIEEAGEDHFVVFDASGRQHPKAIDALFAALRSGIDLAVASPAAPGAIGLAGSRHRRAASALARFCLRLLVPCRGLRDPLSGCFAMRGAAWRRVAARVEPGGAHFLLDLLPAAEGLEVREVPAAFRSHGSQGIGNLATQWQLLVSIARGALRLRLPRRWLSFAGVGALGTVTDAVLTGICIGLGGLHFGAARTVGLAVGMTQNYLLNNRLTFSEAQAAPTFRGWALFGVCQALGALANWGVSVIGYSAGAPWFGAVLLGTAAGMALNLWTASKLVWPSGGSTSNRPGG